jgi:hypothetical protein
MWTQIFLQRIKKEGVENKKIISLMEVSETAFYSGIKNDSFKFQNVLKVYKHFKWDMNELMAESVDIINDREQYLKSQSLVEKIKSDNVEDLKKVYDSYVDSLKEQINQQNIQIEFLQGLINKKE